MTNLATESVSPQPAHPCVLVIFGITGDLTKRLLYPAICNLGNQGLLNENFRIVGLGKENYSTEAFREQLAKEIATFIKDPATQNVGFELMQRVDYLSGDFDNPDVYVALKNKLEQLHKNQNASENYLFYCAVPPEYIAPVAAELAKVKLLTEEEGIFRRLVVEKPFGHDLASAQKLNQELLALVDESQIFRIDHFLGKETVQNLLAFRFSNGIFEPIWNHRYIDHIQITVAETLGVESRGAYYEHAGALRDMVPNHLFQVLSLIAMEPPVSFSANYIQDEKSKLLHTIDRYTPEQVLQYAVRGQYGEGQMNGVKVPGYRQEKNVDPHSNMETYIAMKLRLCNWRWLHVPFYLRTGKRLQARTSEIVIQFKSGPSVLFGTKQHILPNLLCIKIQPDEGISLRFNAKVPGPLMQLGAVNMDFKYGDYFGIEPKTGYESVLYDCMNGDHTLFARAEMEENTWAIVQPILDIWGALPSRDFPNYLPGSWGPEAGEKLIRRDGREWML